MFVSRKHDPQFAVPERRCCHGPATEGIGKHDGAAVGPDYGTLTAPQVGRTFRLGLAYRFW